MGYHGRFEGNQPQKPKKKAGKIVLFIVLFLVLALGCAAIWGIRYYNEMFNKMNIVTLDENLYETYLEETTLTTETLSTETTAPVTEETEPVETTRPPFTSDDIVNILVVGQAYREGQHHSGNRQYL